MLLVKRGRKEIRMRLRMMDIYTPQDIHGVHGNRKDLLMVIAAAAHSLRYIGR